MSLSFKADVTGPWIVTSGGNIILYSRPHNYSKSNSPDSITIRQILNEQNHAIEYINRVLLTNYNSKVQIFLYNLDEAKDKIGTNAGGFVSLNKSQIFFPYFENPNKYVSQGTFVYLGIHEMVHIITKKKVGFPKSRLFGEGFANAIDGTYGRASIYDLMKEHVKNGNIIKPLDLLEKPNIPDIIFYPQSGVFIKWLFDNYGIANAKRLYKVKRTKFVKKFKKVTGDDFDSMTDKYLKYCNSLN